jgi:2-hydroxy-3-oxopropionate reductase
MNPAIAFFGLGQMGAPMSSRLLAAGYRVTVWNRSSEKVRTLVEKGARLANSAAEAGFSANLVILMLADGAAVSEVLFDRGVAEAMRPDSIVVDMSSIPPALATDHANRLAARGVHHLDAPVSGGTIGAAQGTLAIMVGGSPEAFETARPSLEVMGRPTLIGRSGCGQLAKLANQIIVAATIGAVAEALLLATAGGADPAKVREALTGGFADSMILKLHGERMLNRAWIPGGRTFTQVKDLRTVLEFASSVGLQLPLSSRVAELFELSVAAGFGEYDHSALLLALEKMNPGTRVGEKPDRTPGAQQ